MKTELIVPFLKFLSQTAEDLLRKPDLLLDEVVSLRRECERFVLQLDGKEAIPPAVMATVRSLKVDVDPKHLDGSRSHMWRLFVAAFSGRPWATGPSQKELETAKDAVREFRNRVDHILFALEIG